ncbi:MAG: 50S ribosomal protein L3 [Candidatus Magasanikbacteria bacterium RIFCSPHIGHO2_02_FULL_47_14]|uniref:Large ribosomal subunit protein uL3 n=1 Tax=Candidatus Magasanikbacteria bacterium RIFCSPHIGHO2_02_FULL_47_14 TaxID=1798680 RepID=A0A1F6LYP2_9BACT|nr:MAG: 50S ribosomal protein L3 [Candidatus Magasanikbacteria bacterium RIFCSPHIGHO2_02_FULL_47_14]
MKFILGTKIGMTQVFRDDGSVVPVTRVQAGPCVITQVKTAEKNHVDAVQIGYREQKAFRMKKPQQGHLKGLMNVRFMRDARVEADHGLKRGDTFTVKVFTEGEKVNVVGVSKGHGFQGVVKRHGFHGSPKTHGHKDQLRMPGSIGAGGVQRVFKGMRMGGHMGDARVTVQNLEIVQIFPDQNELLIKGALPGARGSLLLITTPEGKMQIDVMPVAETVAEAAPEEAVEAPVAETSAEATEQTA